MNTKTTQTPLRNLWIVNHYAVVPSKDGNAARHLNLAKYMPSQGWVASLIIASTVHHSGKQALRGLRRRKITSELGVQTLWVRTNSYGRNSTFRLIGMIVFAFALLMPGMTRGLNRPDAVMGSTVHLFAAWAGLRLAKRHGVPFVYEIRDVWPDTLIHLGKLSAQSPIARLMEAISVKLARRATLVVSPLPAIDRYLRDHNVDTPFTWVSNGFDGVREVPEPIVPRRKTFTFMYLGAHGNANALEGLLEAFNLACMSRPDLDLKFRLVGDGPLKPKFQKFASVLASSSKIFFEERIPQTDVVSRVREADCLVANLLDRPVYDYGISLNKLFTYLYSFRPVIFGCSAPNNPIREARCGIVVGGDDRAALASAMVRMAETPIVQRIAWARSGYEHVLTKYSYENLAATLADALADLTYPRIARM